MVEYCQVAITVRCMEIHAKGEKSEGLRRHGSRICVDASHPKGASLRTNGRVHARRELLLVERTCRGAYTTDCHPGYDEIVRQSVLQGRETARRIRGGMISGSNER